MMDGQFHVFSSSQIAVLTLLQRLSKGLVNIATCIKISQPFETRVSAGIFQSGDILQGKY